MFKAYILIGLVIHFLILYGFKKRGRHFGVMALISAVVWAVFWPIFLVFVAAIVTKDLFKDE